MPHDANPRGIKLGFRVPRCVMQQMLKEKPNVRHPVRDPRFYSRRLLLVGLTVLTRQFRCDDLRVI